MASRPHTHAPRHLATALYLCSPRFERRLASSWPPKPLPTRFPMLTFDRDCSSLSPEVTRRAAVKAARAFRRNVTIGAKPKKESVSQESLPADGTSAAHSP